ncbi:MAG: hypothetical protein HC929_09325 [Leptolyngbyaceae cyanobacterium SM2_5_2]|nr:hypothetical protein [Leptolyngbyaceae cyanobacterium SM2_5_2]
MNGTNGSQSALSGDLFSATPTAPPAVKSSEIPTSLEAKPTDKPVAIRRYRGVVY